MKTKFNVGDKVYVPAIITSIHACIDKEISYEMEVAVHGNHKMIYAKESELDVVFPETPDEQQT